MTTHRVTDQPVGAFHLGQGWYLRRGADGSVTILSGTHQEELTLSAKKWATGVASVTAGGYSDTSVAAAAALHHGG